MVIVNQHTPMALARFLRELAGRGTTAEGRPSHLVMGDDPHGPKYVTVPRHLTLEDCRAHLTGTITLGGHLRHEGQCRTVAYDQDTPAGYALLERAAERLRSSGAWPLLEQAPLPDDRPHVGGGKLWLAFDQPVPYVYAFGTAERNAPELRQVRERFPGSGPVRLPGGLYRHGVNVWSELTAVGVDDDTWYTGILALETVAEHLTPAGWVKRIEPRWHAATAGRPHARLPERIYEKEGRNNWLARVAGGDRRWGMSGELILARLELVNQAYCVPPLDDTELAGIAYGMERYPAGPSTTRRGREVRYVRP